MGPLTYAHAMAKDQRDFPKVVARFMQQGDYDLSASDQAIPCFYLGSDRWLPMIFTSMYTMRYRGGQQVKYTLIEDLVGYSPDLVARFDRLFKMVRLVRKDEVEDLLERVLPRGRFHVFRQVRDNHILFRKVIDANIVGDGWRIFADADTMFYRDAPDLHSVLREKAPFSLFDRPAIGGFYSIKANRLSQVMGLPVESRSGQINTGLMGLDSRQIDWEWMEFCLIRILEACGGMEVLKKHPHGGWFALEQTIYASFFARGENFRYLPSDQYVVSPDFHEIKSPKHIFTHFCGSRESLFAYSAIRHIFKQNSLLHN